MDESDLTMSEPSRRAPNLWNATQANHRRDTCVHHLVERQAELTPEAVAVGFLGQALTYRELNRRADWLAVQLRSLGVTRDSRVAICVGRSLDLAVGVLAVLKAGGAYVPLDPRYPADRLAFMLEDAKVTVLLTQAHLARELRAYSGPTLSLDTLGWTESDDHAGSALGPLPTAESLAYVIYTSGSTGKPKGVAMVHRALVNLVEWQKKQSAGLPREARTLQFTSLSFDVSFQEIFSTWASGGTLVLMHEELRYDPANLWRYLSEQRIHRLFLPFIALQQLAEVAPESNQFPATLCQVITAGEQLQVTPTIRTMFHRLRGATLYNHYGPAETHVATAYRLPQNVDSWPLLPSIGKPIDNSLIYLLDEHLQPVTVGEPGELFIGGDCLARGYLDRPDLTEERFLADPFSTEPTKRMYRTGDLARYLPDGNLEFLGRIDNQVKIRGHRVELGEIESVLGQHPTIRECAVIAWGEGSDRRLVAYVTAAKGQQPAVEALRSFLKTRLADYMVPVHYVVLASLPLTPSGKVDRRALPIPQHAETQAPPDLTAPLSGLESAVAEVWKEILRLPHVDVQVTFFDLGGNSLMLSRVQRRLQEVVHRDVPILTLFRYPTVVALAKHLSESQARNAVAPGTRQPASRYRKALSSAIDSSSGGTPEGIAIVGMAGRFPGAKNVSEFWRNLCEGKECLTTFSNEELLTTGVDPDLLKDPAYVRTRGMLEEVDLFDAGFFGFTPRDAAVTDPQQRLLLECAWQALEDGGCDPADFPGTVGVYAGSSLNTYFLANVLPRRESVEQFTRDFQVDGYNLLVGNDKDYLATRVAYKLNLHGPAITVQTACSTSLVAVCQACAGLLSRQCDLALAGGVSISFPQQRGYLYQEGAIASADGHCRVFDADANGTVFGAGVAIVLLKRLADAVADGDYIYAVIKGAAVNNDGADKVSFSAPSVNGQAEVVALAHEAAGISADTVGYVEAHGTGTPLGDPIEVAALTQAFRSTTDREHFCAIGSLKANVGHLEAAAGVTGLIKAALALKHRVIPPTPHFRRPNPKCELDTSPFYVTAELMAWKEGVGPRRAGVSSFGVGGTNAHVVMEEAPAIEMKNDSRPTQLLVLSAKTETALEKSAKNLAAHLASSACPSLADVAYTLQTGRKAFPFRRVVVAKDVPDGVSKLNCSDPKSVFSGHSGPPDPPVVFMFPGQGCQYVNMGQELYRTVPVFREEVDRCAGVLQPLLGLDLRTVLYPSTGHEEIAKQQLTETGLAQPGLFVIEYALARLWISWRVQPAALVGHSVGEYVAAVLADVMSLEDALSLIAERARLMQSMPAGAMLSVRLPEAEVRPLLPNALSVAVINSTKLCVVAGPRDDIASLQRTLEDRGIACKQLQTSHAFHSPMMEPILAAFTERVRQVKLSAAQLPIVSTQTGQWIEPGDWTDPRYWARQLREAVRFADAAAVLGREPRFILLEVGPGQTLVPFVLQDPDRRKEQLAISSMPAIDNPDEAPSLLAALGRLWVAGASVNWGGLHQPDQRRRVPLPGYPFERQRHWLDAPKPARSQTAVSDLDDIARLGDRDSSRRSVAGDDSIPESGVPIPTVVEDLIRRQLAMMQMQLETLEGQRRR